MTYYNNGTNPQAYFSTDSEALAWAIASGQPRPGYTFAPSTQQPTAPTSSYNSSSGHQAPIQIVLEPAEAQNESGEGSGQDDSDGSRRRACERCRKIKVKCEYPANVRGCLRCSKVGLTCVPGQPRERKAVPRLSGYDQVMEA